MDRGVCLVTGASKGIGRGIAIELLKNGYTVYATGRSFQALQEVASEVNNEDVHGNLIPVQCDHSVDEEVIELFAKIKREQNGRIDLLVNNAYSAAQFITDNSSLPFWDQTLDAWDVFNNVGLRNHYRCAVLASRMMVKRRRGLIINISSIGSLAYMLTPPYAIGKCAKDRMALDCSIELRKYNVAFISLWPGSVKTEYFIQTMSTSDSALHNSREAKYLLQNGESPQFVGKIVVLLLEDSNIISKTGKAITTAEVSKQYAVKDNGKRPADFFCLKDMLKASGFNITAMFIPTFVKIPRWLMRISLSYMSPPKDKSSFE